MRANPIVLCSLQGNEIRRWHRHVVDMPHVCVLLAFASVMSSALPRITSYFEEANVGKYGKFKMKLLSSKWRDQRIGIEAWTSHKQPLHSYFENQAQAMVSHFAYRPLANELYLRRVYKRRLRASIWHQYLNAWSDFRHSVQIER